jgi:phosphodiesterase/alkaline phosphatase D-like protein
LGNGTTASSSVPVSVTGLSGVTAIAAGCKHSFALLSDGTVRGWGEDGSGQLGNSGLADHVVTPEPVHGENGGGQQSGVAAIEAGYWHSMALIHAYPIVTTGSAQSIRQTTATLYAVVDPNGEEVTECKLEYGTSTDYGFSAPCSPAPGSGTSGMVVSGAATGLVPNTTYHFRVVATNGSGTSHGEDQPFTTPPYTPSVFTEEASSITATSVKLEGQVNPNGSAVTDCHFDYGPSTAYGSSVACSSSPGSGRSFVMVSASISGLVTGQTYHFRMVATNSAGTVYGEDETFVPSGPPAPPAVITKLATAITHQSAKLEGAIDPNGSSVRDCHFDYGTTTAYGSGAMCSSLPGSGHSLVNVSASISGLSAGQTYHFRVVATNALGTEYGGDETLTAQEPPTAVTEVASAITHESATLNAVVNPRGSEISPCRFEYGTSTSYGSTVDCSALPGAGNSPVAVSASVSGLSANVVYHFRVVATNAGGTAYGRDLPLILEGGKLAQGEPYPATDSKGRVPGAIEVRNPPGTTVTSFTDQEISEIGLPAGAVQVVGGVSYQLGGFAPGSSFDAVFNLPPGSNPTKLFKKIKGTYVDVTSIATISGNTITFHVTDGGQGDEDGKANGVIVDPFVPVRFPAPVVSSVSPSGGPTGGGASVTITGSNLSGANAVKFGASNAASVAINSGRSITAVAPPGAGTVDVTVTTPEGISATSSADRFSYFAPPSVTKVKLNKGSAGGGTAITITGTNLSGATAIKFGASNAASFTVNSSTSISAVTPAAPGGKVDVTVTTPGGTSAVNTKDRFQFLPVVTALSPNGGSKAGGTSVTVTGSGFVLGTTGTVFKFGKTKATSVNCSSTSTCVAVSPAHAVGTVDVRVTVNKTTSATNAPADQFTYS